MIRLRYLLIIAVLSLLTSPYLPITRAQSSRRPLQLDDLPRLREVRDPQCSPDGNQIAYVLGTIDAREDKSTSHIRVIGLDGRDDRRMTAGIESESTPRWSPDGRYLSFTSARKGPAKGTQVWILDRSGGEAVQLTDVKGRLPVKPKRGLYRQEPTTKAPSETISSNRASQTAVIRQF